MLAQALDRMVSGGASRGWANPSAGLLEVLSAGRRSRSGVSVTEETALGVPAVYAAIQVLSESIAQLPCKVYRRLPKGGRIPEINHSLYSLLHDLANPEMTAYEWRAVTVAHLAAWGNAYSEIERDAAGRVVALWPLRPDRMTVSRDPVDGALLYRYALANGEMVTFRRDPRGLTPSPIHHVHGFSFDGLVGKSPIAVMRESIGLALAAESFGAAFFGSGASPSMLVKYPGKLPAPAQANLRNSLERMFGGLDRAHRVAILEEGLSVEKIGIAPNDAQFLETRKFQVTEIARIYRIPPHLLQDLERATFSNIEHLSIAFVTHTLLPWLVRFEQAYARDLLSVKSFVTHEIRFSVDGLLRGDTASRFAAYAVGRQWGWLSANDVRALENLNPVEGGDSYMVPLNMAAATGPAAVPDAARAALMGAALDAR